MLQHIMEKWDSYLSVLLGVFLIVAVKVSNTKIMLYFKYYIFLMIGVVIIDTIMNFGQHESIVWKLAAILSNGVVFVACIYMLQQLFRMFTAIKLPVMQFFSHPNFMVYLGIFLIVENLLWIYVYDHF